MLQISVFSCVLSFVSVFQTPVPSSLLLENYNKRLSSLQDANMQLPPAQVLADWPIPNYVNPPTQGLPLVIVNVIFMALISLAVPLRLYGRYTNKGRLGWDDFNMAIAYVLPIQSDILIHWLTYRSRALPWP